LHREGDVYISRDIVEFTRTGKLDARDWILLSMLLAIVDETVGYATTNIHDLCLLLHVMPEEEVEASHRHLLEGGWITRCCAEGCDGGYSHYTVSPSFGVPNKESIPADENIGATEMQEEA
jgi:hypothetical protein